MRDATADWRVASLLIARAREEEAIASAGTEDGGSLGGLVLLGTSEFQGLWQQAKEQACKQELEVEVGTGSEAGGGGEDGPKDAGDHESARIFAPSDSDAAISGSAVAR